MAADVPPPVLTYDGKPITEYGQGLPQLQITDGETNTRVIDVYNPSAHWNMNMQYSCNFPHKVHIEPVVIHPGQRGKITIQIKGSDLIHDDDADPFREEFLCQATRSY